MSNEVGGEREGRGLHMTLCEECCLRTHEPRIAAEFRGVVLPIRTVRRVVERLQGVALCDGQVRGQRTSGALCPWLRECVIKCLRVRV